MRSTLPPLTLLALIIGTADEASAARPVFGGNVVVTNKTDFAVRVWIRHGRRLVKTARLQPMESVTSPQLRLGNNKTDPSEYQNVYVTARGLEPPIRGRNASDISTFGGPPLAGETHCYDITTLITDFGSDGEIDPDDVILFDIVNGDCETDPEDPNDDDNDDSDDTDDGDGSDDDADDSDETTGHLDRGQERTVMIASSSGLAFLTIVGCLLGRAPRRKEGSDA